MALTRLLLALALSVSATSATTTLFAGSERMVFEGIGRHLDGRPGTPQVSLLWNHYQSKGAVVGQPAVDPTGNVVYGTISGHLIKLSPTGSEIWTKFVGSIRGTSSLNSVGDIFVGSHDSKLYAVTSAGTLKWTYITGAGITASPLVTADDRVVVGSRDGNVYFLDKMGTLLHTEPMGGEVRGGAAELRDGAVVVGSLGNMVKVINKDYTTRWTFDAGLGIASTPLVTDVRIIVPTRSSGVGGGKVLSLRMDGTEAWAYQTSSGDIDSKPLEGPNGYIYVGASDGRFYAIQPDGQLAWRYMTGHANSSPVICRDSLVFTSRNKYCYGLDLNGGFLWKYETKRRIDSQPLCIDNGDKTVNVFFGSDDGYFHALQHNF